MSNELFVYRIDNSDTIVSISDNWDSFASDNAWGDTCRPQDVVGHKLWDFIEDIQTRHLYAEMFRRVRSGRHCRPIPFRCDSPQKRRFLKLYLVPLEDGQIEIRSRILRTELRDPVGLLDRETDRSNEFVRICSMCKKMETIQRDWVEIEEGVAKLRLFEKDAMPRLTHGLCPQCYHVATVELADFGSPCKAIDHDEE